MRRRRRRRVRTWSKDKIKDHAHRFGNKAGASQKPEENKSPQPQTSLRQCKSKKKTVGFSLYME